MNGVASVNLARRVLWSQLDLPPRRAGVWFVPGVYKMAAGISVALAVWGGAASVGAVHMARAAREEVCATKLEAWRARNPALARDVREDRSACITIERLLGDQR